MRIRVKSDSLREKSANVRKLGFKSFACTMLALKAMKTVSAGPGNHSAYVKADGSLWTMGKNDDGQLGVWSPGNINVPTVVSLGSFTVSLGAGGGVSLGAGMGVSLGGGMGVSLGGSIHFGVAKVAIGGGHTIFVREQHGHPFSFSSGLNQSGQLGLGHQYSQSWISQIPVADRIRQVSAGEKFSILLRVEQRLGQELIQKKILM